MRHLVFVTVYTWLSGMQGALHTRQSPIESDKYQVSHRYVIFFWWWAHSCSKHVEKNNKYIKKNCAPIWFYLQDYTRMHGQKIIKKIAITIGIVVYWHEALIRRLSLEIEAIGYFETFKPMSSFHNVTSQMTKTFPVINCLGIHFEGLKLRRAVE